MRPERRHVGEVRAEGRRLSGIVMAFGDVSPSHRERFEPGSLRMAEAVHLDLHHDVMRAVAWHPGGGLELRQDRRALSMVATLPPIPAADRALAEVRAGINGLSVEFSAEKERRADGLRIIEAATLNGIGIVRSPSYEQSTVEARRRESRRVANPWIKSMWRARKAGACDCQGPQCETVSFAPGAFAESLAGDSEMLALAGSNRPLASRRKGTLAIRETDEGDIEVEIDRLAAGTEIGRDVAGQAVATRVVARPWVDVEASEFTETGSHREFTRAHLRGVIVKATTADDGWQEVEIAERAAREAPRRRLPRWL